MSPLKKMTRSSRFAATTTLLALGWLAAGEAVGQTADGHADPVAQAAVRPDGRIHGVVRDGAGAPLGGAMVSALGPTMAFAVTDANGRFELAGLPPGPYMVRAHRQGFAASPREIVEVTPSGLTLRTFALRRLTTAGQAERQIAGRAVLAASFAPAAQGDDESLDPAGEEGEPAVPHDHGETAWRLRHARRSVLKDTTSHVAAVTGSTPPDDSTMPAAVSLLGRAVESSARFAFNLFEDMPLSGQVNLLTSSTFESAGDLFSDGPLPRGIAYVTIGAPAGQHGGWSVRGAMSDGDVSSWIVAGSFVRHAPARHAVDVGLTYGRQQYEGGNPAALAAVSADRHAGAVHAYDTWAISRVVAVDYGGRYAWYDYLDRPGLFSPRAGITVSPGSRTRIRASASQRLLAPGADEFLPPSHASLWLPPERTFSPLTADTPFRVERNRKLELAIEREFADQYVVAVRRFYESVDNQLVTLFGIQAGGELRSDLGHYFIASVGDIEADGWGVTLSRPLAPRIRGSVDYSVTNARWRRSPDAVVVAEWAPSAVREMERFHDVTTAVETDIPVTATRVFVLYRINTAFTGETAGLAAPALDARFDLQITQALPFASFGADWEMLLGIRNLLGEPLDHRSTYDELLVVRPPKRIVGGLLVRF